MSKILVGIVTYGKQRYCLDEFLDCLNKQTKKADVLFVANNGEDAYVKLLKSKKLNAVEDPKPAKDKINKIVNGREYIRQHAIDKGYDYLFFLDSDVLLPPTAIQDLMATDVDVVTGVYLNVFVLGDKPVIAPVVYKHEEDGTARLFSIAGMQGVNLLKIGAAGLGCTLIKREVFNQIPFRFYEKSNSGEDIAFYVDARELGYQPYVHTGVKCIHRGVPKDDPKASLFEWPLETQGTTIELDASRIIKK